jgi:hypothetical protein
MPLNKKTYDWGETGTLTTPSAAKQQSGWVAGEQPTVGEENWIQNNQDVAIRELQTGDNPETTSGGSTFEQTVKQLQGGISYDTGWSYPYSTRNVYDSGDATDEFVDLALCYLDGEKRILALEQNAYEVHFINPTAASIDKVINFTTLLAGLPSPPFLWVPLSICADDSSMYILWEEFGTGTPRHYVQAYKLSDGSVKTGWPSTGTQITSANLTSSPFTGVNNRTNRIIFANNDYLVTANSWVAHPTVYSSSTPMLSALLVSSGALQSEGCGDFPTSGTTGTHYSAGGLTADWNQSSPSVYFTTSTSTSTNPTVCSASVFDLTSGAGYTALPYYSGVSSAVVMNDLTYCGSKLWVTKRDAYNAADPYTLQQSIGALDLQNDTTLSFYNNSYSNCSPRFLASDGLHIYLTGRLIATESTPSAGTLFNTVTKLNPTRTVKVLDASGNRVIDPSEMMVYTIDAVGNASGTTRDANVDYQGPILFDGRDLWCILEIRGSQTYSGKIFRIPRTAIR